MIPLPNTQKILVDTASYIILEVPLDEIDNSEIRNLAKIVRDKVRPIEEVAAQVVAEFPDELLEYIEFNHSIDTMLATRKNKKKRKEAKEEIEDKDKPTI